MAIVSSFRANAALDLYHSNAGKTGIKLGDTANITYNTDAGYLSGGNIQFAGATAKAVKCKGFENTPNGRVLSFLCRLSPTYTGSPASSRPLVPLLEVGSRLGYIQIIHTAAGNVVVTVINEAGTIIVNAVTAGTFSPVSGTLYDIFFTWDGTTTANGFKVYIDATLLGAGITPTGSFTSSWSNQYFSEITFGQAPTSILPVCKIDEWVLWDSAENPASIPLVGGTGSLDGAARTALVDVTSFDGTLYVVPTDAEIKTGIAVTRAGVPSTGTYTATERYTDVPETDVRFGETYAYNSLTPNRTGLMDLPPENKVEDGYVYDDGTKTGTLAVATQADLDAAVKQIRNYMIALK